MRQSLSSPCGHRSAVSARRRRDAVGDVGIAADTRSVRITSQTSSGAEFGESFASTQRSVVQGGEHLSSEPH